MRLSDCFVELVAYVAYLMRDVGKRQPAFDQVKADIHRMIGESERRTSQEGINREDYELARFAVFAWIDEMILSSDWKERGRWQGEQLQLVYYKTNEAGELFFDRLNALGLHQRDVREVYYLCLALGFQGRHCEEGDEVLLDQVKASNLKLLVGGSLGAPNLARETLFPDAYAGETADEMDGAVYRRRRFSWFTAGFLAGPVALFVGLYIIYHFILSHVAGSILPGGV